MPKKYLKPEEFVTRLRQSEVLQSQGNCRPSPLRPTIVRLDDDNPVDLPPLKAAPYLKYPGEGLSVQLCLIVEPGKELRIPLDPEYGHQIWQLLDLFYQDKKEEI